jgi:N-acetylglucosamine-6-sulfatase
VSLLCFYATGAPAQAIAAGDPGGRPNIVVVMTDDQTSESMSEAVMPRTRRLIASRGTEFENFIVSSPQCCPSRATFLTGQYGHNNGVLSNNDGYAALRHKANVLPAWLRRAGYRTAHVGKFLNGYGNAVNHEADVAPGWDRWYTLLEPFRYYDYSISDDGTRLRFGDGPEDYLSDVLTREATRVVHRWGDDRRPFFLSLDYFAPHAQGVGSDPPCTNSAIPASRDMGFFDGLELPMPPSFNEADVTDKPSFVRDLPSLSEERIADIARKHQCRHESLRAVDRGVARVVHALRRTDALRRTVVVFTTDNGFFAGEHRVPGGKVLPYEEAIRLPLLVRVPRAFRDGAPRIPAADELVANVDLAPTILRLAGGAPCRAPGSCRTLDGRSLLPLARGEGNWPADRAVVLEYSGGGSIELQGVGPCSFRGLRTPVSLYVRYTRERDPATESCVPADEREHYELQPDPYELANLYPAPPGSDAELVEEALIQRLAALRNCSGIAPRDPPAPGRANCE